jgi:NADP-dependent 3-hydroxy acid dehydrogenase YdfG
MENTKDIVVVTGASYGVGKATAKLLSESGYHVIAIARSEDKLDAIKNENIEIYSVDITKPDQVSNFCQKLIGRNIVALVNNAGGGFNLPNNILDDHVENWTKSFNLNVIGAVNLTKQIAPIMTSNGGGNVVLITSMAGHHVYRGGGSYTVAKHAEVALAEILRIELFQNNIRVTEIAPGNIDSRGDRNDGNCLSPEDVAEAIRWSIMVPKHVNIEKLSILHINNLSR